MSLSTDSSASSASSASDDDRSVDDRSGGEPSDTKHSDARHSDARHADSSAARYPDTAQPGEVPPPLPTTVHVLPWDDPIVERHGHDPRSAYVEQFWLSVLGPTATWLLRRLVAGFDHSPEGYQLDVAHTARSLGLSVAKGLASPFAKAVQRCVMFGVAGQRSDAWVVRRRVPAISQRHLVRLPDDLQRRHEEWMATTVTLDALQRAHVIAAAMLDAGDDPALLEPQLVAVGVPRRAALEARELVLRRAS